MLQYCSTKGVKMTPVYVDIVDQQVKRREGYEKLIMRASCEDEVKALRKAYEVSRLLYIHNEDVIERNNQMLQI